MITEVIGEVWVRYLSPEVLSAAREIIADRVRRNAETSLRDCLGFPASLSLLWHDPLLRQEFCPDTNAAFKAWSNKLINTRNSLAHGRTILDDQADPGEAIAWIAEIRGFATKLWEFPLPLGVRGPTEEAPMPGAQPASPPRVARRDVVAARINALTGNFRTYVEAYDRLLPFSSAQLFAHRRTLDLRRAAGSVSAAIAEDEFLLSLRSTLEAWGLGTRGSTLVEFTAFMQAIRDVRELIAPLEGVHVDDPAPPEDLPGQIWELIASLGIVANTAKVVAGTKALHHLLPDVVVPMDRAWTGMFWPSRSRMASANVSTTSVRTRLPPLPGDRSPSESGPPRGRDRLANKPNQDHRQRIDRICKLELGKGDSRAAP